MDSNESGIKASQRGPEQAWVYQKKYLRKVFPVKAGPCMKEVTVSMEELKKLTKPFLGWDKKEGKV